MPSHCRRVPSNPVHLPGTLLSRVLSSRVSQTLIQRCSYDPKRTANWLQQKRYRQDPSTSSPVAVEITLLQCSGFGTVVKTLQSDQAKPLGMTSHASPLHQRNLCLSDCAQTSLAIWPAVARQLSPAVVTASRPTITMAAT